MNINLNSKEICFTQDGDFLIDREGRLETSTYRFNNLLKEKISKRLIEISYGFESSYAIHSNLAGYLGLSEINRRIDDIKLELLRTLTAFDLLDEKEINFGSSFTDDGVALITIGIKGSDPNTDHIELGLIIDSRTNTFKVQYANEKEF